MATNLAIGAAVAILVALIGIKAFLFVHLPIMLLAAMGGVWLFYVQHQFECTTWQRDAEWNVHYAAVHGSSHYDLPPLLRWFTANIGVHRICVAFVAEFRITDCHRCCATIQNYAM